MNATHGTTWSRVTNISPAPTGYLVTCYSGSEIDLLCDGNFVCVGDRMCRVVGEAWVVPARGRTEVTVKPAAGMALVLAPDTIVMRAI